jgi:hypothetical protein
VVLMVGISLQELSSNIIIAEFDKTLKKHNSYEAKVFNDDTEYKRCVSEVLPQPFFLLGSSP